MAEMMLNMMNHPAARTCNVSFPERATIDETDDPQTDSCPKYQLVETINEVWQQTNCPVTI